MSDFPLRFEVRPLLVPGMIARGPHSIAILLADNLTRDEAAVTIWHEVVHMLKMAGGDTDHDEAKVEAAAKKLAACCPEVVTFCGLDSKVVAASGIEPPRLTLSESGSSAVPS